MIGLVIFLLQNKFVRSTILRIFRSSFGTIQEQFYFGASSYLFIYFYLYCLEFVTITLH